MVVLSRIAIQVDFQFFAGVEVVRLQQFFDPAVEVLDHAVGLRMLQRGKAMLDASVGAELVELVPACGLAVAQAEQTVDERFASVNQHVADAHQAGPFQIAQEAADVCDYLGFVETHEHPSGRPINRHEQIAARSTGKRSPGGC